MYISLSQTVPSAAAGEEAALLPQAALPVEEGMNRRLFDGDFVYVGLFHCRPWHPLFRDDNASSGDLIVFPRSSVYITHEGEETLVADPNVVVFYNEGQMYQRDPLSEAGDFSEYFGYHPEVLLEVLQSYNLAALAQPGSRFQMTHAPSDPQSYLWQQMVVQHLLSGAPADAIFIEETALALLERVLANTLPQRRSPASTAVTRRAHRDLAHAARSLLAAAFHQSLTVTEIASALYTSPYHLSRVFRQQTGETLHQYRNQLRLRTGLSYILDTDLDLSDLALRLGYASHSHFTQAFRRAFRVTPSTLRQNPSLEQLSSFLTV